MGKTIAFLSQKGGVGKSTLARAVACEASKSGLEVRLADLLVLDGAPCASSGTLEAALAADLSVLPCCPSRDDLVPELKLACELERHGVSRRKICGAGRQPA